MTAEMEAHRMSADPVEHHDPDEQAVRAATTLVEDRITADHEKLLRKIDFALLRLEDGTYQQCANCEKKIPLERLRAKPSASLCLACQELKDAAGRS